MQTYMLDTHTLPLCDISQPVYTQRSSSGHCHVNEWLAAWSGNVRDRKEMRNNLFANGIKNFRYVAEVLGTVCNGANGNEQCPGRGEGEAEERPVVGAMRGEMKSQYSATQEAWSSGRV